MATTQKEIREWLEGGKLEKATHMLVVCDTYDYDDYPVYVKPGQDPKAIYAHYHGPNMQKVMEVYSYNYDLEGQLGEFRACHLD